MADEHVAYFWERENADAVAELLAGQVRRGRFHGEDDDEDHPWVLVLPAGMDRALLESLLAENDGWLESAEEPAAVVEVAPPPLPEAPRRIKNPPA